MQDRLLLGKTNISIELAKSISGEVISADSMQVYNYMDIGSAKPNKEEMQGIKHYMLDVCTPDKRFSVADYKKQAIASIKEVIHRGKAPIVVGGTGLYINALIYGIDYPDNKIDEEYRKSLEERAKLEGLDMLYEEALKIDPESMEKISRNDQKRIIRVLEIFKETGKTKTELERQSRKNGPEFDYKLFALKMERGLLCERINKRVDLMVGNGLIEEVKRILGMYDEFPTALQAIGYKETKEYLDGKITKEKMIEKIKLETRKYAKRQMTWFRKNKEAVWLDACLGVEENIQKIIDLSGIQK